MISAAQKKKILESDTANIVRKVKAGKTLTEKERLLIASAEEPPAAAPAPGAEWETKVCVSMAQAVAVLNEHLPQLGRTQALTKRDLRGFAQNAAFADAFRGNRVYLAKFLPAFRGLAKPAPDGGRAQAPPRNKDLVELEIAEEKLAGLRRENSRAEGELVEVEKVLAWLGDRIEAQRQILRTGGRNFLPRCEGLRTPQMLAKWDDEFLPSVQKPLEELAAQIRRRAK